MATINGTNSGDSLYGGAAADVINGLNGNDTLKGFGGADRLDGGNGIDTVFYGDSTAGVGINLATGRGVGGSAQGDTLISIENVFGSNFNDTLSPGPLAPTSFTARTAMTSSKAAAAMTSSTAATATISS